MTHTQSPAAYQVNLSHFEGPLDLLWHLIQESKIDIFDIPIAHITTQYLSWIAHGTEINLMNLTDFYVLATQLIAIKSRMLHHDSDPPYNEHLDGDPRKELVAQLIEHQRIKKLSAALSQRVSSEDTNRILARQGSVNRFSFLASPPHLNVLDSKRYSSVLLGRIIARIARWYSATKMFAQGKIVHINESIHKMLALLEATRNKITLTMLMKTFSEYTVIEQCISSLNAVLFGAAKSMISIRQDGPFSDIWIAKKQTDE